MGIFSVWFGLSSTHKQILGHLKCSFCKTSSSVKIFRKLWYPVCAYTGNCLFDGCEQKVLCSGTFHHPCLRPPEKVVLGTVHSTVKVWKPQFPGTHELCLRPPSQNKEVHSYGIQPTLMFKPKHGHTDVEVGKAARWSMLPSLKCKVVMHECTLHLCRDTLNSKTNSHKQVLHLGPVSESGLCENSE